MSFFYYISFPRAMTIDLLVEQKEQIFQDANDQALDLLHQLNRQKKLKFSEQNAMLLYDYGKEYYHFHLAKLIPATGLDFMGVFTNSHVYYSPWTLTYFDETRFIKDSRLVKKEMTSHDYNKLVAEMIWEAKTSSIVAMRQLYSLIKTYLRPGEKVEYYQLWVKGDLDEERFQPIHHKISITLNQLLEQGVADIDDRTKVEIFI